MSAPSYVTPADLITEFGEDELVILTDRATPRTGEVDLAVAQQGCDRANAEVNIALAGRYRLPLSAVPEAIPYLARDLAHFYLHQQEPAKYIQARYDTARRTLRDIQAGTLPLGVDAGGATLADVPQDLPEFSTGGKDFGRGNW